MLSLLLSTLIVTSSFHHTTAFQCSNLEPCDCRRENGWTNDKIQTYNVVECEGELDIITLNLSSLGNIFIKKLSLKNSSLSQINAGFFRGLQVNTVIIENSDAIFSDRAFLPIKPTLRHLALIRVTTITNSWKLPFLKGLTQLENLELDSNGVFPLEFPKRAFRNLNLTSLKYLSLRHCEIAIVPEEAFEGLFNLEVLDMSYNQIPFIPAAILWLKNLRKFVMTNNQKLVFIHSEAFLSLHNLREIDLGHSQIKTIQDDAFRGLENSLEDLKLNHGALQNGHFSSMKTLKQLKRLDISYNKMLEMNNSSFVGFYGLEYLDISGQYEDGYRLVLVDAVFRGIENSLTTLKLRDSGMDETLPLAPLTSLKRLKVLDVSDNDFREIQESFFDGIRAKIIYMTDMEIVDISSEAFDEILPNVEIIFDRNNITNISFILDTKMCTFKKLSFQGNPVACDCDVVKIAATNRVQNLVGACADGLYRGEDLRHLHENAITKKTCGDKSYKKIDHCYMLSMTSRNLMSSYLYIFLAIIFTILT